MDKPYGLTKRINITLPVRLIELGQEYASIQHRSFSNFISCTIASAIGYAQPEADNGKDEDDNQ